MGDWTIRFLSPWWLLLLLTAPLLVVLSRRSLAGLGSFRRGLAILLRLCVVVLLVAALADLNMVKISREQCTLFVLDQSQSMPESASAEALRSIEQVIRTRPQVEENLAGLVVFGTQARIEVAPAAWGPDKEIRGVGSIIDRQYSNIAAGINLALGSFPPDAARRIVLISDGNENRGSALDQALTAYQGGVPIDVVPITYKYDAEVLVDKIVLPSELREGDTANLKIVLRSAKAADGLLRLARVAKGASELILEQPVSLQPGLNVFVRKQTLEQPGTYTYEAEFVPGVATDDQVTRNNQAKAFTQIFGEGRVLLVAESPQIYRAMTDQLQNDQIDVTVYTPDQLENRAVELQEYDSVILANVPSEMLPEDLQKQLAANTRDLGAGLIMLGGENSFGAGGYRSTPIEEAMPVTMDVPATKVRGRGALALIMHACEIPEGNFWQKRIAKLAIGLLSDADECGLLFWNGNDSWLFPLQTVGGNRDTMLRRIDGMTPGDMPQFQQTMSMAEQALSKSTAMTRHVIIISDGDPQPPTAALLQKYRDARITCTAVAVDSHGPAETQVMRSIANDTRGRFYRVTSPRALPQIYIKETRIISRPLLFEQPEPWSPFVAYPTPVVAGMPKELPGIKGLVLTTRKPTADVAINSPLPVDLDGTPVLAHWQYGLGRTAAWTTDVGERWAVGWPRDPNFPKLFSQLVRWSMRPSQSRNLILSTQENDGEVTVVVNALDTDQTFLNFLQLRGRVLRPGGTGDELTFEQTAPGKYIARFAVDETGPYFLQAGYARPDGGLEMVRGGLNVPYPPEYRATESNADMLETLASVTSGRVVPLEAMAATDFFVRSTLPNFRLQDAWPLLLLAALVVFLLDVAVRRIAISPSDVLASIRRALDRMILKETDVSTPTLERLRGRKAEVGESIGGHRFQVSEEQAAAAARAPAAPPPDAPPPPPGSAPPPPRRDSLGAREESAPQEDTSYLGRLKRAKKQTWDERDEDKKS